MKKETLIMIALLIVILIIEIINYAYLIITGITSSNHLMNKIAMVSLIISVLIFFIKTRKKQ